MSRDYISLFWDEEDLYISGGGFTRRWIGLDILQIIPSNILQYTTCRIRVCLCDDGSSRVSLAAEFPHRLVIKGSRLLSVYSPDANSAWGAYEIILDSLDRLPVAEADSLEALYIAILELLSSIPGIQLEPESTLSS